MAKVEANGEWGTAVKWETSRRSDGCEHYAGIALGPESDEGEVRVNGVMLAAGAVLALPSASYVVEKVLGRAGELTSVRRLEVILYEHPSELPSRAPRAHGRAEAAAVAVVGAGLVEVLRVPFIGRRVARCIIVAAAAPASGSHAYEVTGRAYSPLRGAVDEVLLVAEADGAFQSADGTTAGFYVGGTNEGESWHELVVEVSTGDGVATTFSVNVETIDEGA